MSTPLAYLATPYTHPNESIMNDRVEVATIIAGILFKKGYFVFSVITHCHPIRFHMGIGPSWETWQEYDKRMISVCDVLLVLTQSGWDKSIGVSAEIQYAKSLGIPVQYVSLTGNITDLP